MSRLARIIVGLLLILGAAGVWLVSRPAAARAQATSGPATAGARYQLNAISGATWVILDTQSGAFEVWSYSPRGPSYQVQRAEFGATAITTRVVSAPRPAP